MRISDWSSDVCSSDLLALDPEAFEAELQRRCGERLGTVRLVGRRFSYPLSGLHARSYVADRVALMGEAAHDVHPIAAQGLNLSIRDAAALAEIVGATHRHGLDIRPPQLPAHYPHCSPLANMGVVSPHDT